MKPIKFKESNCILTKPKDMTDEECKPLSVFRNEERVVSCWKASFWERFCFLFHGKMWVDIHGDTGTQPPMRLIPFNRVFEKKIKKNG